MGIKEVREAFFAYRVRGVMIKKVLLNGDIFGGWWDKIATPGVPPNTIPARMRRVGPIDPKQGCCD